MPDESLPKKSFNGEVQEGKRPQGGQKKRYKDTLKALMKAFDIPTESWKQAAQDRTKWRCLIYKGATQFESKKICEAERKRKERNSLISHALFATDSLELKLAYTAINEHTITHEHFIYSGLRYSFSVQR